jgi:hypothetical protein
MKLLFYKRDKTMAVFKNDPFEIVYKAFKNLFPDKYCEIWWDDIIQDNEGEGCGYTVFPEENNSDETIRVYINTSLSVKDSVEILAHELAHVGVGVEHNHDEVWYKAFDDMFDEYNRLIEIHESNRN